MTTEYNKIHALARARKVVMDKFGSDLLYFWPMADTGSFIHDLQRTKPLFGRGLEAQQPGMLDYGVSLGADGYASDVSEYGDSGTVGSGSDYLVAAECTHEILAGIFTSIEMRAITWNNHYQSGVNPKLRLHVVPRGGAIADALMSSSWYTFTSMGSQVLFTWMLPSTLYSDGESYNLKIERYCSDGGPDHYEGVMYSSTSGIVLTGTSNKARVKLVGTNDTDAYGTLDKFTVGALVNVDNPNALSGAVLTLADSSDYKARVFITSDKKAEAKFVNLGTNTYTVTSTRRLHPGYNLITASYEKGVAVKLGINGKIVPQATPSAHGLFNTTLAVCLGAQMTTNKVKSQQLVNALLDDVFVAQGVISDQARWDIFAAYIISAPLMLVEDTTRI